MTNPISQIQEAGSNINNAAYKVNRIKEALSASGVRGEPLHHITRAHGLLTAALAALGQTQDALGDSS